MQRIHSEPILSSIRNHDLEDPQSPMSFPHPSLNAHKPAHLIQKLRVALRGDPLLNSPRFNKGTAFSPKERKALGLHGRLPYRENTLEHQCERAYEQLQARDGDQEEHLLAEPEGPELDVVFCPVAEAFEGAGPCHLYAYAGWRKSSLSRQGARRSTSLFCTDAEAILGIGDQGVGGIGISTAKSAMYTLIGGLDPSKTLAVMLDVGTNNEQLLKRPLYVGWPHRRVTGEDYDKFVDKFVQLVRKYYPHSLLHFEDFGVNNAYRLLHKYRETHAAFNDDIQGTGAVTLACIMAAIGVSSRSSAASTGKAQGSRLSDQRYVIFGAGSAGMGIAVQVRDAMITADGISRKEANRRFWLIDREGLLYDHTGERSSIIRNGLRRRPSSLGPSRKAGKSAQSGSVGLLETVKKVKPTVLIGCSTAAGAFTEEVVKAMDQGLTNGEKPIIMPLSNPSRLVEAQPVDIMKWTEGRALVATGSPFGTVEMKVGGKDKSFRIAEFKEVTDSMLIGAQRLARLSPAIEAAPSKDALAKSSDAVYEYNGEALLPDFAAAPQVNYEIGVAVAQQAVVEGTASSDWLKRSGSADDLADSEVRDMMLMK
ncbi:hypothetical protein D9611_014847 [Ephemerocybe angulata]|uniref:Malic enzyme n=1 Tax=Ephemerocybe angulata TaxID=980116 RepID=A0A8H5AQJ6_9AGAR|nr:hypothetical protein D9611_014847 [Tulosesus angulatus]